MPEYYNDDLSLPILERIGLSRRRVYTVEDIVQILLNPKLPSSKFICTEVPTLIHESVSFVVDVEQLDNVDDVLADDMGVWKNNGVDTNYVRISVSECKVDKVEKCTPLRESPTNVYRVKRVYRIHSTDGSLKKLTTYVYGMLTLLAS